MPYLKIRAERGQHNAMAGELLSTAAQCHITEGIVQTQTVKPFQHLVGMACFYKHVFLTVQRGEGETGLLQNGRWRKRGHSRGSGRYVHSQYFHCCALYVTLVMEEIGTNHPIIHLIMEIVDYKSEMLNFR